MAANTELSLGGRIDGFEDFGTSGEEQEADVSLYEQTKDGDQTLVASLHCRKAVIPTWGRWSEAEYDVEVAFTETPRGVSRRVKDTGAAVEFRGEFYGSRQGESFFVLYEKDGEDDSPRMGSLALKHRELSLGGSLPVESSGRKRKRREGPVDTCYVGIEFELVPSERN